MQTIKTQLFMCFLITILSPSMVAQTMDTVTIKAEIKEATEIEQNAFRNGECDTVLSMMDDNITFLANGRQVPSKKVIGNFCNSIKRPFRTPLLDAMDIYPLTENAAYTVRKLEYQRDITTKVEEYVTKIWKKTDGVWKITHLHSTVKTIDL